MHSHTHTHTCIHTLATCMYPFTHAHTVTRRMYTQTLEHTEHVHRHSRVEPAQRRASGTELTPLCHCPIREWRPRLDERATGVRPSLLHALGEEESLQVLGRIQGPSPGSFSPPWLGSLHLEAKTVPPSVSPCSVSGRPRCSFSCRSPGAWVHPVYTG